MTDPNYTALLLIIDRSGSMAAIRDDMIGGLTSLLAEQASEKGLLTVDILSFDDSIELQCSLADPSSVQIALEPRGMTALYDGIGIGVAGFGQTLAGLPEHARPGIVQVVVVTDGHENASREYTADQVRALVTRQTEKYGWDFVFLGANQDAVMTGATLGFEADSSMTYTAAADTVGSTNVSLGRYMKDVRKRSKRGFDAGERGAAGA